MNWKTTLTSLLFVWGGLQLSAQCTPAGSPTCVANVTTVQQLTDCIAAGDLTISISSDLTISCNYDISDTDLTLGNQVDIRFNGSITVNQQTSFIASTGNVTVQIGSTVFASNSGNGDFTIAQLNSAIFDNIAPGATSTLADILAILPVEFISFTGKAEQNIVALHWATATESNNKEFEVEHSLDGKVFKMVQAIPGAGTSFERQDYTFEHRSAASGINYYRLRQVDFDGTFAYSDVISVQVLRKSRAYSLFPNPAKERITILTDSGETPAQVQLYNTLGQEIKLNPSASGHYDLPPSLQSGTYIVRIEQDGALYFEKLLVQ